MPPGSVKKSLAAHFERVKRVHVRDLAAGFGRVQLPDALARKYVNANRDWGWQWIFPASKICRDPRFGEPQRYHIHESVLQRATHASARKAGVGCRFH
ncbi:MAG: integron integrase [Deltaproteobacteria bacterium]|nr:integron integrase [Deltaproteobacteria bacterium]